MPERERKQRPAPRERVEEDVDVEVGAPGKQGEKIKEELDGLLDEIDSVLEENAEDFVRNYVQKGGE
jgi:ubiquitin-like protein Pup